MEHVFQGTWITDREFFDLPPRNVFHKQLDKVDLPCNEHRNRHILFRKSFTLENTDGEAQIYITADDYYKLYINGRFVGQGPAPSYHFQYNYNVIDVSQYLQPGRNVIAVHTLYQGLINRVWQSGDQRHGLLLDLQVGGQIVLSSDESFKTAPHTAYTETGTCGYATQFLERYDSCAPEVGFQHPDYDDSKWENARRSLHDDHVTVAQKSGMLEFESILPVQTTVADGSITYDFGSIYVGYLCVTAQGKQGDTVTVRCAQELDDEGNIRYVMRAKCTYEEDWLLADGESELDWFDYKAFRYVQLVIPEGVQIKSVYLQARHYPFTLKAGLKPEYAENADMQKIWNLCVHSQKYGVQEVIQDCMEREKGFYLGDGCYTALSNMLITGDDSMVRKLIDDAFTSSFITDTLMTCMDCSFMQEIAEYPMIMVYLVLWHYHYTGDREYLAGNYPKVVSMLEAYRREYEKGGLLRDLDKWCVVEWPKNFQHNYDVNIREGQVCTQAHVSINAYYLAAIRTANHMAQLLQLPAYRDEAPLLDTFYKTFYNAEKKLFKDGEDTESITLVGNSFVYAFGLCRDGEFIENFISLLQHHGPHSLSMFCTFPVMMGHVLENRFDLIEQTLLSEETWKRMLREGATTTFEGWKRDMKSNTSLFHLTMSYALTFMVDVDLRKLFFGE